MTISEYIEIAGRNFLYIVQLAGLMLCIALWIHRKAPRVLLSKAAPKSLKFNLLVALIDTLMVAVPLNMLLLAVTEEVSQYSAATISPNDSWPTISTLAIGLSAIFLGDLVSYWRHRLEHTRWLWQSHAMHHSDESMHWLTIYRFHPINRVTTSVIDGCALLLLGFPSWAILLNGLFRHYYGAFVHIDQPWTLGRWGNLLVSPAMHRWHHVYEGPGVGKNFATVFSIFDRAFGTYYCPGPCTERLGAPDLRPDIVGQYLAPLSTGMISRLRTRRAIAISDRERAKFFAR